MLTADEIEAELTRRIDPEKIARVYPYVGEDPKGGAPLLPPGTLTTGILRALVAGKLIGMAREGLIAPRFVDVLEVRTVVQQHVRIDMVKRDAMVDVALIAEAVRAR